MNFISANLDFAKMERPDLKKYSSLPLAEGLPQRLDRGRVWSIRTARESPKEFSTRRCTERPISAAVRWSAIGVER